MNTTIYKSRNFRHCRLPHAAHSLRPWRIHKIVSGFRVEGVWSLPTPGRRDDFHLLIAALLSGRLPESKSVAARILYTIRLKLGDWLGWDAESKIHPSPSLKEQLPADLCSALLPQKKDTTPGGENTRGIPVMQPLYLLPYEYAAELANKTVHAVIHLGWVLNHSGHYNAQMAILVKPNGLLGKPYMALIKPFRHLIIYPSLMRQFARMWRQVQSDTNHS